MNSYRRGLRNGVLGNPKLFILEKVDLAPHTNGWSNLVKHVKNLYYLVRVVAIEVLFLSGNSVLAFSGLLCLLGALYLSGELLQLSQQTLVGETERLHLIGVGL